MAAYVIADVTVKNPDVYAEYRNQVLATVTKYGGRFLVRGGACDVVEGDWRPGRVVVIEFPEMSAARRGTAPRSMARSAKLRQTASTGACSWSKAPEPSSAPPRKPYPLPVERAPPSVASAPWIIRSSGWVGGDGAVAMRLDGQQRDQGEGAAGGHGAARAAGFTSATLTRLRSRRWWSVAVKGFTEGQGESRGPLLQLCAPP